MKKNHVKSGYLKIFTTQNNTLVSITDLNGKILCWSSGGEAENLDNPGKKLKNSHKKTEHAAYLAILSACKKAKKLGVESVAVRLKHDGSAHNVFAFAIADAELEILSIKDITSSAFNGCRRKKPVRKKRAIDGVPAKHDKDGNYTKADRYTRTDGDDKETDEYDQKRDESY